MQVPPIERDSTRPTKCQENRFKTRPGLETQQAYHDWRNLGLSLFQRGYALLIYLRNH